MAADQDKTMKSYQSKREQRQRYIEGNAKMVLKLPNVSAVSLSKQSPLPGNRIMPPKKRLHSEYKTSIANRNVKEALNQLDYRMVERDEW